MKIDLNDTAALIEQLTNISFGAGFALGLVVGILGTFVVCCVFSDMR